MAALRRRIGDAFAVHMALGAWWPVALLIGIGWGTVIVNLDRMLLVGMAHDASLKRNLMLAVPRVGLALILGVVISTPLTLQIFHKEIDSQVVALQAEASDAYKKSLDSDSRFAGLADLRAKVAEEQAVVASGGASDAAVSAADAAAARGATQAAGDLATDQAELTRLTDDQTRLQAAFDATNSDNDGILIRLQALSRLSDTNATLATAHFMLALLFISIEILPVLMKILLNFSPATAY